MRSLIVLILLCLPGCESAVEPDGARAAPPGSTAAAGGSEPPPTEGLETTLPEGRGTTPPDSAVDPATQSNVILDQPEPDATITENPVVVRGRARTFENNVEIRIDNASGQTIEKTFATARGELGSYNPFEKEIFLTTDPGDSITMTLIERSMKDGSIRTTDSRTVRVNIPRKPVTLFFPSQKGDPNDCTHVDPVVRNLPVSLAAARLALEALIDGPTRAELVIGATNSFPQQVAIRSVNLRGGTLTVDFGPELVNVGGSCRVQAIRAAVERTGRAIEGVERVRITAMGSEDEALQP